MHRLTISKNKKYLLLIIALYGFVLENFIALNVTKWFDYMDEALTLLFGLILLYYLRKKRCTVFGLKIILLVSVVTMTAILSTIINEYQPIKNCLLDLFAVVKFPVVLLGALYCFENFELKKSASNIAMHIKVITIFFSVLTLIDLIFDAFPDSQYQFYKHGFKSLRLIYGHPATLSVVCLLLLSILIYLQEYGVNSKIYQCMLLIMMTLTLRAKIIGTIAIMIALYLLVFIFKKKITVTRIMILVPFAILFAWSEIQSYYVTNQQASRLVLTLTSLSIAKDYFPLGTGLATFGSAFSSVPYSPVYAMYGISEIWGLSEKTAHDISDTFWPMILAQFGIVALCAYIGIIYCLYKKIQTIEIDKRCMYLGCWSLFIYLLIASTSESAFVNSYAVFFAIFIGLFISVNNTKDKEEVK